MCGRIFWWPYVRTGRIFLFISLVLFSCGVAKAAINPLADYHFDECEYTGTGTEIFDSVGGLHAQAVGGVTTADSGQVSRFADFQLHSQNFIPSSPINIGSDWAVSVWMKMPFVSTNRYHVLGSVTGGGDLMYFDRNANYRWGVYRPSGGIRAGSFRFGTLSNGWHHLVLVGVGGKTSLYVDGSYRDQVNLQTTGQLSYLATSYDNYGRSSAQGMGLPLDEFMILGGGITATDISQIYTNQLAGNNWDGSSRSTSACGPFFPVAEYRLDECLWDGTTGEVKDSSGNNLNGTAVLSPVSVDVSGEAGGVCRAASMGGVSHLAIPDNNLLDITDNLTAMAWVKPDTIPSSGIKSILSKDTNYEFHINSAGQIYWWWRSGGRAYTLTTTSSGIVPGNWYHIAVRFEAGVATIFVNGVPSITRSGYPVTLDNNSDPLQIGGDYIGTRYFEGMIDEVMVFNQALPDATIQNIYSAQLNNNNYDNTTRICTACDTLGDTVVISAARSGAVLGSPSLTLDDSDLVEYTVSTKAATLVKALSPLFSSGSNHVSAAHIDRDGSIYFSPSGNSVTVDGLVADADDILRYDPASGLVTTFMNGDSHFSNRNENIDALYLLNNGNVILSTTGNASLGGLSFRGEDLVEYNPVTKAASLYFDGSTYFTGSANIDGIHIVDSERLLLSTSGNGRLGALSFQAGDVVLYNITPRVASIFLTGSTEFGTTQNIDAVTVNQSTVSVDHYEILHDGTALTCQPEDITLAACLNDSCSSYALTETTLTLTPTGWVGGDVVSFTSLGNVQLRHTTPGTVTLGISDALPVAQYGYRCVDTIGGPSVSCDMEFFDSGFAFSVPTQVSNKTSAPVTIAAVRKDDTSIRCVPAFSNRTVDIEFWSSYVSPASGTMSLAVNGTGISSAEPGTILPLDFDVNGESSFTVKYPDAGQIQLDARFTGSGDEAGLIMTGNSRFVVHPAGLCVYSDQTDSDCATGDGTCSVFAVAGKPWNLKVKGVGWESDTEVDTEFCDTNPITPNYQHSGILISHNLVAPLSGVLGNIGVNSTDIVSGGESVISQTVSEVGVFTFTADPPADYLGAGDVFSGGTYTSANIGRFRPDHFVVSIAPDPPTFGERCLVFTYLGQPFDWQTVPDLTITAMNGATVGVQTENYEADFWKLDSRLDYGYTDSTAAAATLPFTPVTSYQDLPDTSDCGGTVTLAMTEDDGISGNMIRDGFNYTRPDPATSPVSPFAPDVTMQILAAELTDTDSVCFDEGSGCVDFTRANIGGNNVRHGRSVAQSVFGPETQTLIMPVAGYYYDGSSWLVNPDDDCSQFSYVTSASGTSAVVSPGSPVTLVNGMSDLSLVPAAGAGQGTVTVSFDFDSWLEPDPSAVATFGISRGNDRILNWQEVVR